MSISKRRDVANHRLMEIRFFLAYHLQWDMVTINEFIQFTEKKSNFRNHWLQQKELKEHDAKLDEIAKFVTKYINLRKLKDKG